MSKKKKKRADRAATTPTVTAAKPAPRRKPAPSPAATRNEPARPLTFGRDTYVWIGIGFALVWLGLFLMKGARPEDPTVYDVDYLYSFRRITLAPLVILGGLSTVIYAILKK